jgi:hypothetical protein
MTSNMIRGSIAIFCMPIMHTPFSLMYVMRLKCVSLILNQRRGGYLQDEVHDDKDCVWHFELSIKRSYSTVRRLH